MNSLNEQPIPRERESFPSASIKDKDRTIFINDQDLPRPAASISSSSNKENVSASSCNAAHDNNHEDPSSKNKAQQPGSSNNAWSSHNPSSIHNPSPSHNWFKNILALLIIFSSVFALAYSYKLIDFASNLMEAKVITNNYSQDKSATDKPAINKPAVIDRQQIKLLDFNLCYDECEGSYDDDGVYLQLTLENASSVPIGNVRFFLSSVDATDLEIKDLEDPASALASNTVVNLRSGQRYFSAKGYAGPGQTGYFNTVIHVANDSPEKSKYLTILQGSAFKE